MPEVDLKLLTEQRNMFYFYYQQLCQTLEIENNTNDKIFNQFDIFDSKISESCNDFKNYQPTANNSIANFLTFLTEIETWIRTLKRKNHMISDEFEEENSEKMIALPGYEPVVTSNFQNLLLRFSKILMKVVMMSKEMCETCNEISNSNDDDFGISSKIDAFLNDNKTGKFIPRKQKLEKKKKFLQNLEPKKPRGTKKN